VPPRWLSALALPLGLGSRWDSTRRSAQSPKPVERRSRKSPEKLRLPQPTERERATFLPKDDEEDPSLRRPGLSGSSIASSLRPSDADVADATDTDFLLADDAAPPPSSLPRDEEDAVRWPLDEEEDW